MTLQGANFGGVSMDAFFSHTQELLSQGYTQVLIGMYIAAQAWWWLKKLIGVRNKRFQEPHKATYSVIVVAYRPDPTRLSRTLKSIAMYGSPAELIVAIDDAPKAPKKLKTIAAKYATKVIEASQRYSSRELYAKAAEALKKRSDIIITVAPGAVWDETTLAILSPFADERVGAVTGCETIVRPKTFMQRLGAWISESYFTVIMPFQSALGSVRPLSPNILAARRDIFVASAVATRSETFLGRRMLTAFHESLTANILNSGHRTVYQPSAIITVPTPETFAGLRKTYLQRYRGNLRSLIRHGSTIRKSHPFVTLSIIFSLFSPLVYLSIATILGFMLAYGVLQFAVDVSYGELAGFAGILVTSYFGVSYLRHISSLNSNRATLWLPVYVIVGGLIIFFSKMTALFTFTENARDSKTGTEYGEGKVGRARTAAAGFSLGLFLTALFIAYSALVSTQNVPFGVIANQQGRPFTMAREFSERLRDANAKNDPSVSEYLAFMRINSAYYGQSINDAIAENALLCVRDALKTSSLHGALDNSQACYARALAMSQSTDSHFGSQDSNEKPSPILTVTAQQGDTLTWLIRAELKRTDTKKELSAAQAVYIETTYLSQTGQLDRYVDVGEKAEINMETLEKITQDSKKMTPQQIATWGYYAQNIVW